VPASRRAAPPQFGTFTSTLSYPPVATLCSDRLALRSRRKFVGRALCTPGFVQSPSGTSTSRATARWASHTTTSVRVLSLFTRLHPECHITSVVEENEAVQRVRPLLLNPVARAYALSSQHRPSSVSPLASRTTVPTVSSAPPRRACFTSPCRRRSGRPMSRYVTPPLS
jgi:hypothetical protein